MPDWRLCLHEEHSHVELVFEINERRMENQAFFDLCVHRSLASGEGIKGSQRGVLGVSPMSDWRVGCNDCG